MYLQNICKIHKLATHSFTILSTLKLPSPLKRRAASRCDAGRLFDFGTVTTATSTRAYGKRAFVLDGTGLFQQGGCVGKLGDDT